MYKELLYEVAGPVATISINRPDPLNALTDRTQVELKHALIQAEKDERVVGIISHRRRARVQRRGRQASPTNLLTRPQFPCRVM